MKPEHNRWSPGHVRHDAAEREKRWRAACYAFLHDLDADAAIIAAEQDEQVRKTTLATCLKMGRRATADRSASTPSRPPAPDAAKNLPREKPA